MCKDYNICIARMPEGNGMRFLGAVRVCPKTTLVIRGKLVPLVRLMLCIWRSDNIYF